MNVYKIRNLLAVTFIRYRKYSLLQGKKENVDFYMLIYISFMTFSYEVIKQSYGYMCANQSEVVLKMTKIWMLL